MMTLAWFWLYAGAALMLLELAAPGFVVFFFGLAAASVGLLRLAFGDAFTLTMQVSTFSLLSIFYIVLLRRWLKSLFSGRIETASTEIDATLVGRVGKVTEAIVPPLEGRVEIGDAQWTACAATPIAQGTTIKVVAQKNLTLKVESVA